MNCCNTKRQKRVISTDVSLEVCFCNHNLRLKSRFSVKIEALVVKSRPYVCSVVKDVFGIL